MLWIILFALGAYVAGGSQLAIAIAAGLSALVFGLVRLVANNTAPHAPFGIGLLY